jgi:hypothetical protein
VRNAGAREVSFILDDDMTYENTKLTHDTDTFGTVASNETDTF